MEIDDLLNHKEKIISIKISAVVNHPENTYQAPMM